MTTCSTPLEYRRLRAPLEDRAVLVDPPLDRVGTLVDENVHTRAGYDYDFQGRSLADLSWQARRELLREARRWTAGYCDVGSAGADRPGLIFLAGHQPELFHPGVWLKNFALDALARRHAAAAVSLLIDSDTVQRTQLRIPVGSVAEPSVEAIPFDRPDPKIPYEVRQIVDRRLFAAFGSRVARRIAPLVADPLIETYWPLVQRRMQQTDNLGACLAQARHQLEARWGFQTLEIPQSLICESEPFCWFVAHLLAQLPRLWTTYNQAVGEYRRVHRTRSATHPVPDLGADRQWLEAPLWIFSAEDPRRRRLFARQRGDQIVLWDRHGLQIGLPLAPQHDAAPAVERLMQLRRQGVRIRSRALITTLWARLALGDLFIHGIGGAKYDQVTDLLIQRFFGLRPPAILVLSATLHLPIERQPLNVEQSPTIRQQLRDLVYHPERHINTTQGDNTTKDEGDATDGNSTEGGDDPTELIAEKTRWVQTPQTHQNARLRCRTIRRINRDLQPRVEARREQLLQQQTRLDRALRAEQVLASREYGFCLYPERTFRGFLRGTLPKDA